MTACAIEETAAGDDGAERRTDAAEGTGAGLGAGTGDGFTISADGCYAARLAGTGDARFAERWTLDGPEPYAVPLPLDQPEEPDAEVAPMADGRVLIRRRVAGLQTFSLLYPTGPGTGQLPLGAVESTTLTLLPPSPNGTCVYALVPGERSTAVWLVAGGAFGPERVAQVPGRCSGGVWLDRTGRMLALDRETDGITKAIAVDLERGGEVTPLLQITEDSNDRLLLADAESGLLLIRSDAAGHDRLGWGVLGSLRPVRFPECLRLADAAVTPFAIQPGQMLMPENCSVALRIDAAAGSWVGVWRPSERRMHQLAAPEGWLTGAGLWTREGALRLPYATGAVPCGVARVEIPDDAFLPDPVTVITESAQAESAGGEPCEGRGGPSVCRPVPLQQAPLIGRVTPG
ncbi:hypothetical protein ACWCXB_21410 [Streptomyces sp. NPDC001514]